MEFRNLTLIVFAYFVLILVSVFAAFTSDGRVNVALTYTVGESDNYAILIRDEDSHNDIYYEWESNTFICPGAKLIKMPAEAAQVSVMHPTGLYITAEIDAETLCVENQEWFDGVVKEWGIIN